MESTAITAPPPEGRILRLFADRAAELLLPLRIKAEGLKKGMAGRTPFVLRLILPNGSTVKGAVDVLRRATPRLVEDYLRRSTESPTAGADFILAVAPFVSEDADRIFRERGAGYVDLSGNALIQIGGVAIDRRGRPSRFREETGVKSLFAPKSARVLRVMLEDPKKAWTLVDLARRCQVSIALVQKLRDALAERALVRFAPKGTGVRRARPFVLSEPARLLDRWSAGFESPPGMWKGYYALEKDRSILTKRLAGPGTANALTGFAAATVEAPYVRSDRIEVYCESPDEVVRSAGLRPAEVEATVFLASPADPDILKRARMIQGRRIVSPVLVYLDLTTYPGRGQEQAAHYREKVLGY